MDRSGMDRSGINRKLERELFNGMNARDWHQKIGQYEHNNREEVELHSPPLLKELKDVLGHIYVDYSKKIDIFFRIIKNDEKVVIDPQDHTYKVETKYNNPHTKEINYITIRQPYQPADDDNLYGSPISE